MGCPLPANAGRRASSTRSDGVTAPGGPAPRPGPRLPGPPDDARPGPHPPLRSTRARRPPRRQGATNARPQDVSGGEPLISESVHFFRITMSRQGRCYTHSWWVTPLSFARMKARHMLRLQPRPADPIHPLDEHRVQRRGVGDGQRGSLLRISAGRRHQHGTGGFRGRHELRPDVRDRALIRAAVSACRDRTGVACVRA
jgi:hypothetical protein